MAAARMTVDDNDGARAEDGPLVASLPIPCLLLQW
jgi:hypothetical protein